jgi:hypothetical protein
VVGNDGEKIQLGHESDAWVQRPNKLRSDRAGELATVRFYYDGKDFTIYGEKENVYATAPAPPNLDQALDQARDRLAIEAPAADLVYSDVYRGLMEDVTSGRYLGSVLVDGQRCHHLAYRGREVDWQIWIEDGPKALPCKYLIVSKTMRSQPEFSATFSRWDLRPLGDEIFRFTPPVGAERIEFLSRTKKGKTP